MGRGHDGAHPRLSFWHRRERNPSAQDALFEQLAGEFHRPAPVTNQDGRDWCFAGRRCPAADVESEQTELFLPEARVLPEFFNAFGFLLENIEGCDTGGRHCWRMRG